jgi:hypothetical protein
MPSLNEFLKFLAVSPPSGLIIAKNGLTAKKARTEISKMKIARVDFDITEASAVADFFDAVRQSLKLNGWLVLNIKTSDIPAWLYDQLRTLSGNGHLFDRIKEKDYNLMSSAVRVLAVMKEKDLENCPFETFQSCFGIIFRNHK